MNSSGSGPDVTYMPLCRRFKQCTPGVSFGGAYQQDELAAMYAGVHFMWSVDHADKELNSKWLLPNRLYEGNYFDTPNIG